MAAGLYHIAEASSARAVKAAACPEALAPCSETAKPEAKTAGVSSRSTASITPIRKRDETDIDSSSIC